MESLNLGTYSSGMLINHDTCISMARIICNYIPTFFILQSPFGEFYTAFYIIYSVCMLHSTLFLHSTFYIHTAFYILQSTYIPSTFYILCTVHSPFYILDARCEILLTTFAVARTHTWISISLYYIYVCMYVCACIHMYMYNMNIHTTYTYLPAFARLQTQLIII